MPSKVFIKFYYPIKYWEKKFMMDSSELRLNQ